MEKVSTRVVHNRLCEGPGLKFEVSSLKSEVFINLELSTSIWKWNELKLGNCLILKRQRRAVGASNVALQT
jgi:hypothetical protein